MLFSSLFGIRSFDIEDQDTLLLGTREAHPNTKSSLIAAFALVHNFELCTEQKVQQST